MRQDRWWIGTAAISGHRIENGDTFETGWRVRNSHSRATVPMYVCLCTFAHENVLYIESTYTDICVLSSFPHIRGSVKSYKLDKHDLLIVA